jgi:lipid II:glycine glycyltransferase (peptidoglycan interpeptide bridge formation enzyme)
MHVQRITDPTQWNAALLDLPVSHVLQTWEWGAFKARYGWTPARLLFEEGGFCCAAASVLQRHWPRLPLSVMYVPKGPALNFDDVTVLDRVLAELETMARRRRAIFIKIDPDVNADAPQGEAVLAALRQRGWRASAEQIQFRNTMTLDLASSEDTLLAGMKSKTRYNVRLAGRKGVRVRLGDLDDLPRLYEMYAETAARDDFIIRPLDYYRHAWGDFISAGLAQPFVAEFEGEILAALILFRFGRVAWYMYGASSDRYRNTMPNHLLQWEAMRWAKRQGCTLYDLWGAPDELDESDPMWGVYRFKAGFGGRFVRHIGAYDYPVSRMLYWLYIIVMPRYLDLLRVRHRQRS